MTRSLELETGPDVVRDCILAMRELFGLKSLPATMVLVWMARRAGPQGEVILDQPARKQLMTELNISKQHLTNQLATLRKMGIITQIDGTREVTLADFVPYGTTDRLDYHLLFVKP